MKTLEQHITQYAAYHRDRRNILTHFFGIPLILLGAVLAFAQFSLGPIHGGWPITIAAMVYYLMLDRPLGVAMFFYLFVNIAIASLISAKTTPAVALTLAAVFFVGGWALQFLGHKYEGLKPAFVDDLMGLAIGPLFVMTEVFFFLHLKRGLREYVEARVGPVLAERNGAPIGPAGGPAAAHEGVAHNANA
jgi:uncharacterized membrane protein YGL010W